MEQLHPAGTGYSIPVDDYTPTTSVGAAEVIPIERTLPLPDTTPPQTFTLLERVKVVNQAASDALRLRRGTRSPKDPDRLVFHDSDEEMPAHLRRQLARISIPFVFCPHLNGMEASATFLPVHGELVAHDYEVDGIIGRGSFSTVFKATSLDYQRPVSLKILRNEKDCFDAGLGEVRIHSLIIRNDPHSRRHLLRMLDCFYFREHLMVVTELLNSSLLAHYMHLELQGKREAYYNAQTLGMLSAQIIDALSFLHGLSITHCDIKTPNICIVNAETRQFKLIDFGAAVLTHDTHTSYLQSRWYRAPEVMLGCAWGELIDIWSFGCVVAELALGCPLYQYNSIELVLAAIKATRGNIPTWMLEAHPIAQMFFSASACAYEVDPLRMPPGTYLIRSAPHTELRTILTQRLDPASFGNVGIFVTFLEQLLTVDPKERPDADACMESPFLKPFAHGLRLQQGVNVTETPTTTETLMVEDGVCALLNAASIASRHPSRG